MASRRVPPSARTKEAIQVLLNGGSDSEAPTSELVRLASRLIVEEALESKARDVLGREYYGRREGQEGYRNGYRERSLKSAEGEIPYSVPQLRGVSSEAMSEIRDLIGRRTEELTRLAIEAYARGCSTRDIEAMFTGEDGDALLSRTAVSEITEALWEEYEAFSTRDLSSLRSVYLFVDGIAERLRPGAKREAVLAAWAITEAGEKLLVAVCPGSKESTECCREFFEDLKRRGLEDPVLVVSDGAAGLIRAIEECFPSSLRGRCLAHKIRNIVAKLPSEAIAAFKQAVKASYEAPSPAMARALRDDLVARFEKDYPSAVRCFLEDFEACIAHLRCPPAHHRVIRTTNLLERLFGEERRRVRAVGRTFGERPVLKLMYATLVRASERWRGIRVSEFEARQLQVLREQLIAELQKQTAPVTQGKQRKRKASRLQQV